MRILSSFIGLSFGLLFLVAATSAEAASASVSVTVNEASQNSSYVDLGSTLDQEIPDRFRPVQYDLIRMERADYYFFPQMLPDRLVETGGAPMDPEEWPSWIGVPSWWY